MRFILPLISMREIIEDIRTRQSNVQLTIWKPDRSVYLSYEVADAQDAGRRIEKLDSDHADWTVKLSSILVGLVKDYKKTYR